MIKLYHASLTRSVRVLWLLEELGLPHEVVKLDFMGGDLQKPDYLARNPMGKVPTLDDGEVRIFESGAIIEYLLETYDKDGRLAPKPGSPKRPQFLQWLHWAESTAMPSVSEFFQNSMLKPEADRIPQVVVEATQKIAKWLGVLDKQLAGKPYVLGDDFSAADVALAYTVNGARFSGQLDDRFKNVQAWLARANERPAAKKAQAA
jgi:glutathione S-transferase